MYTTKLLTESTWPDFVRLVEANKGVWGGCWCMGFHPEGVGKLGQTYDHNRDAKHRLVTAGEVNQILVYDGDEAVGWCQFGRPAELPSIHNRRGYEEADVPLPDWRIGCVFTSSRRRGTGVASTAVSAVVEEIRAAGGGTVEALNSRAAVGASEDDGCMPAAHRSGLRVNAGLTIPESELSWRFSRSSGPGGQGVNTADSRVELLWGVAASAVLSPIQRERILERLGNRVVDGVLTIAAYEHRAQLRNREAARVRLVEIVSDALRPPAATRRPTRPSRGAMHRRSEAKKRRADVKRLRRPPGD